MLKENLPSELTDAPTWAHDIFHKLPPLVSFCDVAPLIGMSKGSLSNMLSEGRGPAGGLLMGRRRMFPRINVVIWIMGMAASKEAKVSTRKGRAA